MKKQTIPLLTILIGLTSCSFSPNTENSSGNNSDGMPQAEIEVRFIDVKALPYYVAKKGRALIVDIDPNIDRLLASNKLQDWRTAENIIFAKPGFVDPNAMYIMSARAYDLGFRDDAIFWYFVGEYRWNTLLLTQKVSPEQDAQNDRLNNPIGPHIYYYADCDKDKKYAIMEKALNWVKNHPYQVILSSKDPVQQKNRQLELKQAEQILTNDLGKQMYRWNVIDKKEQETKKKATNLEKQYCWKS